ncbi:MAG: hypothetical protein FWC73_03305 [Defluviitaleaceae bacterium]|nr:hypothetical protein [Defluviitaleaceae bacterium]
MFCPGCGTQRHPDEVHLACACGYVPTTHAPVQGGGGTDFVKTVTSKFTVNQLVVLGGCLLLLICMFMPFISIAGWGGNNITVGGFSLVFNNDAGGGPGFSSFLDLLLPLLVVAGASLVSALGLVRLPNPKLIILVVSGFGAYLALSNLVSVSGFTGFGLVLFFILWLVVTAAAFMEYKDIHLVKL